MLRLLMLQRQRTALQTQLKQLRTRRTELKTRETQLQEQLEKLPEDASMDEIKSLQDQVDDLTRQQNEVEDQIEETNANIEKVEKNISEAEASQGSVPNDDDDPQRGDPDQRHRQPAMQPANDSGSFRCRSRCFASRSARDAFYGRSEVREFLGRVRSMLGNQPGSRRTVNGADLTIPTVVLDIIRDNLNKYSKLLPYVSLKPVSGRSRQNVIGDIPEGVWMEMTGVLNDLTFTVNDVEMDGFKVGGVIIISNSYLEDSDINLGEEILYMLGQSIGMALDKAIVYGKGAGQKMPIGIMTRLAETTQPSYWDANRMPWIDLHSSHVIKLNLLSEVGTAFFTPLLAALAKAKPKKDLGEKVWIMNEAMRNTLMIKALAFNAAAALVSQLNDTMPVVGGKIITLDFMPDNNIVGGYLSRYLLAERQGSEFGYSDLPMFIQDKTVFKGTARYDGQPIFGESFVAVSVDNTNVVTAMDFVSDYANQPMNALIVTAAAGSANGKTVLTVAGAVSGSPTLKYKAGHLPVGINVGDKVTDFEALTSGTTAITAVAGTPITVVELDKAGRVISLGYVTSVPKAS